MNSFFIVSSQLVFEGSADTQVFLINKEHQTKDFLISFSGFLNSTRDNIENFRCSEMIIYTGENVKDIVETTMQRSKESRTTEHYSFRRYPVSSGLKPMVVDWIFSVEQLMTM